MNSTADSISDFVNSLQKRAFQVVHNTSGIIKDVCYRKEGKHIYHSVLTF